MHSLLALHGRSPRRYRQGMPPGHVGARSSLLLRRAIDGPRCSCRPVVTQPLLRASHTLVTCDRRYQAERLSQPVGYNHRATLNVGISQPWITPLRCYMSLRRLGIMCGILGPLLWLSLIGMAGAMRPEFSHITHYISELGERGSSTEFLMRYGAFAFTGLLYVCFAAALLATFRDGWYSTLAAGLIGLDGLGRIGAGVFACDPGCGGLSSNQELHHLFATLGFSSGILAAIAWGFTFHRRGWPPPLTWYSVGTGILALIFLLIMSWSRNSLNAPGLFEHLATGVLSLWLLVFAASLTRHPDQALRRS